MAGKFVISLDFELHWGVFDTKGANYDANLIGARESIKRFLNIFRDYNIKATWAIVGLLLNSDKNELKRNLPDLMPTYLDASLNPYVLDIGHSEKSDPIHYAWSLIKLISQYSDQEIGSHTFSHFYCLEAGQTADQFDADLAANKNIVRQKLNIDIKSLVFPKNQVNPEYFDILKRQGVEIFRNIHEIDKNRSYYNRIFLYLDSYLPIISRDLNRVHNSDGLRFVYGDRFLRPSKNKFLDRLLINRVKSEMLKAAKNNAVYHLWWHPHNFGNSLDKNFHVLQEILDYYIFLNEKYQFQSNSMADLC